MTDSLERPLSQLLAQVVPGTLLRDGLERVLRAHMGALVVLGDGPEVLSICSGGFHIDAEMTPQRLSELAKMDGAIILDEDIKRITWANVHLMPDPTAPTTETGTRHRTAERVARCVDVPVVAVSEEMGTITLYRSSARRVLRSPEYLGNRANHLLQTLGRFRASLDDLGANAVEEDGTKPAWSQLVAIVQRSEMVTRVADEIAELLDELGAHGKLLQMELDEQVAGVADQRTRILEGYADMTGSVPVEQLTARLRDLSTSALLSFDQVAAAIGAQPFMAAVDN